MLSDLDTLFEGRRVMAILRGMPQRETVDLATRAWDLGITCVEVPAQTPEALAVLRAVVQAGADRGHWVGAGTVITPTQVDAVADAGAAFTVAPGFDPAVLTASLAQGLPHLPGVATPSEAQQAVRHGLTWLKAFPATALGVDWFSAVRGPFPEVKLVATGGVNAHNARDYFAAGARVAAVGSALSDPGQIELLGRILHGDPDGTAAASGAGDAVSPQ